MTQNIISVGIVAAESLKIRFDGSYGFFNRRYTGDCEASLTPDGLIRLGADKRPEFFLAPVRPDACFELHDVMIGVDFHWQRTETQRFAGALRLVSHSGKIHAINCIDIEEYLKSVISSEMNGDSPIELLKAHAVISRSWLLAQIAAKKAPRTHNEMVESPDRLIRWFDREDHDMFDVCADDHCQRYQGLTRATNPRVAEAVEATRGQVLTYDGRVCDTRFSKCCGGRSELFGSCWDEGDDHPYLTSVECPYCDTHDSSVLATVLNGYDCETRDFHDWTVSYTPDRLSDLVRRRSGIDFGTIKNLRPLRRGPSGRIIELEIEGTRRTMTVGKELMIRRWLSESHLYSSAFDVETSPSGTFTLRGHGWGHGVGLCQIGAAVMASQGKSYTDILSHYFPAATLSASQSAGS